MFLFLLTNEWWGESVRRRGGFAASPAGTAPLYYKSAEIASGSEKICAKKWRCWGACLLCRPPTLPLACFPAPYPPDPLPRRGRGCPKVYFAGGFAPGTPAFTRLRHLQNLPSRCPAGGGGWLLPLRHLVSLPWGRGPSQTPPSLATDSSISPGPPSPWLPALLIERRFYRFCAELAIAKAHPPRRVPDWQVEPVPPGACPGDARGEAPCMRKLKSPPSPWGKGGGGMGAESKTKGKVGGRPTGHAPPPGTTAAEAISAAGGSMQGCQGRSPLPGDCSGTPCRLHLTSADRAPYTCRRKHPRRNRSAWSGGAGRQSCPGVRRARAPH